MDISRRAARAGRRLAAALSAALLLMCAPALANVSGLGPGDTIGQPAGPLGVGVTYAGAFGNPDDLDFLFFDTSEANTTLLVTVSNTLRGCANEDDNGCPLWATLLDTQGKQLGGEGSTAGTGRVDYRTSDSIEWTFPQAGRYILVLESSGDLPTYQLRLNRITPTPTRSKILLTVRPSRVRAGNRVYFRFLATLDDRRRTRVAGVAIRFAGRTVRTGSTGRAGMTASLRYRGIYRAKARKRGLTTGTATVVAT